MKLSVGILTYNQAQYIRQCLDAVLMQEVDFDYEIVIGDDASTDGTIAILEEYARKCKVYGVRCKEIRVIKSEKNEGISMNYKKVLSACTGDYIALCEGDDYWTDPRKLQVQVDFLDAHPDYGFVGTYNTLLFPDGTMKDDPYDYFPEPQREGNWELYGDVFEYAKCGPVTRTVSLCFRRKLIEEYIQYVGMGNDMVLQTILAKHSLFAKHSASMCVYRLVGISNTRTLEKELYYNNWYVQNRLLQKKLSPEDCNWNEVELMDRETYIRLKDAIKHRKVGEAMRLKRTLKSDAYKIKLYSKFLFGPVTCLLLSFK
jgi:glycosyltransferase involved in cell wall biosynthesis